MMPSLQLFRYSPGERFCWTLCLTLVLKVVPYIYSSYFLFAVSFIGGPQQAECRAMEEVVQVSGCKHRIDDLHFVTGLLNIIHSPLGMCDVPLLLVSTDTGSGSGTSGCSAITSGKKLTRDIVVSLEKSNEKQTFDLIWHPVVVQDPCEFPAPCKSARLKTAFVGHSIISSLF